MGTIFKWVATTSGTHVHAGHSHSGHTGIRWRRRTNMQTVTHTHTHTPTCATTHPSKLRLELKDDHVLNRTEKDKIFPSPHEPLQTALSPTFLSFFFHDLQFILTGGSDILFDIALNVPGDIEKARTSYKPSAACVCLMERSFFDVNAYYHRQHVSAPPLCTLKPGDIVIYREPPPKGDKVFKLNTFHMCWTWGHCMLSLLLWGISGLHTWATGQRHNGI